MVYNFNDKLAYSQGYRLKTDTQTIANMIPGCSMVNVASLEQDKKGVDYVATLNQGATILIDAKTREPGCSRYWQNGPEIALEVWSVRPGGQHPKKPGWTLSTTSNVDYVMFTFDKTDSDQVFMYPFQLLRSAFLKNGRQWHKTYKVGIQNSGSWQSECIFVPESVVFDAMRQQMLGKYAGNL